jgi:hypothetical protein
LKQENISIFLMSLFILMSPAASAQNAKQVFTKPESINWKPIVLTSVDAFKITPPPGNQITLQEQKEIIDVQKKMDSATLRDIHYWNAGPPAYRWQKLQMKPGTQLSTGPEMLICMQQFMMLLWQPGT